ncbi:MAG TPA: cation-translocating P-type ATPase [Candidatus Pacearchaeota archaeon]|nr:cation-translocating P-type ATPase [Candidatus Parcubacteria bacterium]HOU46031.1 cation-translocating P-type ATPase [Candidatus Pacearchaeota archaeon]HPM08470.1 cation-translocating P-type ATPase [Candidatus Pacearchaeota archaeon]
MDQESGKFFLIGLKESDAQRILKEKGYNELPWSEDKNFLQIFLKVVLEPMLLLLLITCSIYFSLGSKQEALMLFSFVFFVIGITFYQERKTEKTLHELRNLSSPRALVIRDGEQKRISGRELVIGDLIVLQEGDRIPADSVILSCSNFSVDESLLTGESLPVLKDQWDGQTKMQRPGKESFSFVYSGTMVVSGHCIAQIAATGSDTEMGRIGRSLKSIKDEETLLKKEIKKIARYFFFFSIALFLLIIFFYSSNKGNFLNGLLYGLSVGMSMLPEEFPVVFVIFMTLGAWRMSKYNVLTRNPSAIETLGSATVLCVDKTGTLTTNQMKLEAIYFKDKIYEINSAEEINQEMEELMEYAELASRHQSGDPIEKEIKTFNGNRKLIEKYGLKLLKEYHLSKHFMALSHVWDFPKKRKYLIACKGAPESVLEICKISDRKKEKILKKVKEMSDNGFRVLGVAKSSHVKTIALPESQKDFDFKFLGLLGFIDPIRESVDSSLKEAYQASIRIIMVTGDYPGTAQFVAKKIGLKDPDNFITGLELSKMNHLELREKIKDTNIFARMLPEQKLDIVNALKANGEIVAMTGDGVNDAPALKAAHIGISMGMRGTDVAREASSLVLLDDDFCSIVTAIRMGRKVFDNLRKAVAYIFAIHIPIAGMAFLPVIFNLPIVLLPAHIAFLELIIDPASSTIYESLPEEKGIMAKPPRKLHHKLFDSKTLAVSFFQGFMVLFSVFLTFYFINRTSLSNKASTIAFVALVFSNLALILSNISWSKNIFESFRISGKATYIILSLAVAMIIISLYVPFLRNAFHFDILNVGDFLIAFACGIITMIIFEFLKILKIKIIKS